MKSKTSSFNTTIFKKNLTHHWPIWIVYLCYLIVVVPLYAIWLYANNESNYIGNVPLTQKQYHVIGSALAGAGSVIPVFIAAAAAALAVFSYLYNPRNANMIHSLPLDRREALYHQLCFRFCFSVCSGTDCIYCRCTGLPGKPDYLYPVSVLLVFIHGRRIFFRICACGICGYADGKYFCHAVLLSGSQLSMDRLYEDGAEYIKSDLLRCIRYMDFESDQ